MTTAAKFQVDPPRLSALWELGVCCSEIFTKERRNTEKCGNQNQTEPEISNKDFYPLHL